jgi:putative chitinase
MAIQKGSTGDNVKRLQTRLGITSDGVFGDATTMAVKAWQKANNLEDDGIVGNISWNMLFPNTDTATYMVTEKYTAGTMKEVLDNFFSHVIPTKILNQIPDVCIRYKIDTPLRLAHFLSQCAVESATFTKLEEDLRYSGERLYEVFKSHFKNQSEANGFAKQPQRIANRVYCDRNGNGSEISGDGWLYRGRGLINTTGKSNYNSLMKAIGVDFVTHPELVATDYCVEAAAYFFKSNEILPVCDRGADISTVKKVTKIVNGGYEGLDARLSIFIKYYDLLSN